MAEGGDVRADVLEGPVAEIDLARPDAGGVRESEGRTAEGLDLDAAAALLPEEAEGLGEEERERGEQGERGDGRGGPGLAAGSAAGVPIRVSTGQTLTIAPMPASAPPSRWEAVERALRASSASTARAVVWTS